MSGPLRIPGLESGKHERRLRADHHPEICACVAAGRPGSHKRGWSSRSSMDLSMSSGNKHARDTQDRQLRTTSKPYNYYDHEMPYIMCKLSLKLIIITCTIVDERAVTTALRMFSFAMFCAQASRFFRLAYSRTRESAVYIYIYIYIATYQQHFKTKLRIYILSYVHAASCSWVSGNTDRPYRYKFCNTASIHRNDAGANCVSNGDTYTLRLRRHYR